MGLLDMLGQVAGNPTAGANPAAGGLLGQVLSRTSPAALGEGLAAAMRSDQTPAIGDIVGQLFGRSSPTQQAGLLNQLIATLGPAVATALAGGALAGVLRPGQTAVDPEQAGQLSPEQVGSLAEAAAQHSPGIVDMLGRFYAEHTDLVQGLGGNLLTAAMAHLGAAPKQPGA